MLATDERFVQAHRRGNSHTDRDWYVHVGAAMAKRLPGRPEERSPGIGDRREGDQRGNPVEKFSRGTVRTRPHADRKQHDVHRRKTRDGQSAQQFAHRSGFGVRCVRFGDRYRFESQGANRFAEIGIRQFGVMGDGDLFAREVDARGMDAKPCIQAMLDPGDAAGTMHAGHRKAAFRCRQGRAGFQRPVHDRSNSTRLRFPPRAISIRSIQRPESSDWRLR